MGSKSHLELIYERSVTYVLGPEDPLGFKTVALAVIGDAVFKFVAHESHRCRKVYHRLLPREAYYSSKGSVASV